MHMQSVNGHVASQSTDTNYKNSVHYLVDPVPGDSGFEQKPQKPIALQFLSWPEGLASEETLFSNGAFANLCPRGIAQEQFWSPQSLESFSPMIPLASISARVSPAFPKPYLDTLGFNAAWGLPAMGNAECPPEHRDSARPLARLSSGQMIVTSNDMPSPDTHVQQYKEPRKYLIRPKRQWGLADWSPAHAEERLQWRRKQVREALRRYRERNRTQRACRPSLEDQRIISYTPPHRQQSRSHMGRTRRPAETP
jgi:hypothetical protein